MRQFRKVRPIPYFLPADKNEGMEYHIAVAPQRQALLQHPNKQYLILPSQNPSNPKQKLPATNRNYRQARVFYTIIFLYMLHLPPQSNQKVLHKANYKCTLFLIDSNPPFF